MPDQVDRARLVEEAIDDLLVVRELRVQELDRDAAADDRVLGEIDRAHAAAPEQLDHPVAADVDPDQLVVLLLLGWRFFFFWLGGGLDLGQLGGGFRGRRGVRDRHLRDEGGVGFRWRGHRQRRIERSCRRSCFSPRQEPLSPAP